MELDTVFCILRGGVMAGIVIEWESLNRPLVLNQSYI